MDTGASGITGRPNLSRPARTHLQVSIDSRLVSFYSLGFDNGISIIEVLTCILYADFFSEKSRHFFFLN